MARYGWITRNPQKTQRSAPPFGAPSIGALDAAQRPGVTRTQPPSSAHAPASWSAVTSAPLFVGGPSSRDSLNPPRRSIPPPKRRQAARTPRRSATAHDHRQRASVLECGDPGTAFRCRPIESRLAQPTPQALYPTKAAASRAHSTTLRDSASPTPNPKHRAGHEIQSGDANRTPNPKARNVPARENRSPVRPPSPSRRRRHFPLSLPRPPSGRAGPSCAGP